MAGVSYSFRGLRPSEVVFDLASRPLCDAGRQDSATVGPGGVLLMVLGLDLCCAGIWVYACQCHSVYARRDKVLSV